MSLSLKERQARNFMIWKSILKRYAVPGPQSILLNTTGSRLRLRRSSGAFLEVIKETDLIERVTLE
jgi:hypothetical protein